MRLQTKVFGSDMQARGYAKWCLGRLKMCQCYDKGMQSLDLVENIWKVLI